MIERYVMTFGSYFKDLRCNKHITQRQVAEAIGKSAMLISGIENGKNSPFSERDLDLISKLLELSSTEKKELFNVAARARGRLPEAISDYIFLHPEAYELLEVLAQKKLNGDALLRVVAYVERNE